ncbi:protein FAR1-RELATED SEQUENCE 5-like [Silene latifolia]|uniref:protein FAR1-RELATED SEQUENCE 5-like n=1 Tax=Silene latifolia TaxID=37657 RepID=UPI003D78AB05
MSDPTSTVTSSSPNDIHESAIISNYNNDILESSITSTVHIEPPDGPSSTTHVEQHHVSSRVHQLLLDSTPGGSELRIRKVALEFKPHIGQFFGTLEEAISFYGVYAKACGFEPKKFSQKRSVSGDVQYKFVVCNREGFRDRKRKAIILHSGEEQATPKPFDIRNTKLTRIGCTAMIEFRYNGDGDIKCFIGDRDAQLFVNHFEDKRDTNEGFYFAYEVDSGKCLVRAFWCDAVSRRNYSLFGDYITYDPTYSTNKYYMVFTPFTGVDHHKRSVTFAAALLFHEYEYSFKWVFEKFLDAMGQREPHCIMTDQCAGIKKGLRAVFKHARLRYCMWHIMQKLIDKVGPAISKETDFVSRLNAIVWDAELKPLEFEEKWSQLVNEHNLEGNSWLSTMFRKRRKWIPAYFRDIPMGCLLRTTQRSESQSNFFKRFENAHGTLVEFWMRFQSAIDVQCHTQKQLDRDDDYFQLEATASICSLSVGGFTPLANGIEVIGIADARTQKIYQVVYNSTTNDAECSSKLFNRKGIICRHIIWVYSGKQVHTLPDKYILMRWTKNAHKIPLYGLHGELMDDFDATDLRKLEMCKLWSEFYATISVLKNVPTNEITNLVDTLKQFRVKLNPQSESITKEQELEMLLGCSSSTEVRILPPRQAKNKGSGKRMISKKQQCIAKAEKPKRLCHNCKQMAHHDKRNCPNAFVPDADNKGSSDEDDADHG